jgi:hypothetical protein
MKGNRATRGRRHTRKMKRRNRVEADKGEQDIYKNYVLLGPGAL